MNPSDSHLMEGHIGVVRIGTASWTDRSLIDSGEILLQSARSAEGCRAEGRGLEGRVPKIMV